MRCSTTGRLRSAATAKTASRNRLRRASCRLGPRPGAVAPSEKIRLFLLDDHEVVRQGLRSLVEADGDIQVVDEAGTAADALIRIPISRPDVAVLDVRLPDGSGVEVCREIKARHPEVACLMLTSFADDEALFAAIMAGAAGYVLKQIKGTDLVEAIRTVAAGNSLLDPALTRRVLERLRKGPEEDQRIASLTEPERPNLAPHGEGPSYRHGA